MNEVKYHPNMRTYQFDMDGVAADFVWGCTSLMQKLGIPITPYGTKDQKSWDFQFSKEDMARVWDAVKESPTFWEDLPVLCTPEEGKLIAELSESDIVYFTTSRAGKGNSKEQTERWLRDRLGVKNPTVIVTPNKGEFALAVGVDYSIDDKAGNAVAVAYFTKNAVKPTKSFLLNQQYNQFDQTVLGTKVVRVPTIKDFLLATAK